MKKKQERIDRDEKMKKLVRRNWILAAVSLMLAILAYVIFR